MNEKVDTQKNVGNKHQTNPKLNPLTCRKSNMTTDIEHVSYLKDTDIDTNEKADAQKNVGNKRQTSPKLRALTNRKSNMTTDIEYESYLKDTDIDTSESYSNVYTSVFTYLCFTRQNFITKHHQQKFLHISANFFSLKSPLEVLVQLFYKSLHYLLIFIAARSLRHLNPGRVVPGDLH